VKTHINGIEIPNTLIDLGAAINIMSKQTMNQLKLPNPQYTPTLLQLVDSYVIKHDDVLEDIFVSLESWEYPIEFMILTPENNLGGHPLILGRPWLTTFDAFIACRSGDMFISDGSSINKFTLYPPAKMLARVSHQGKDPEFKHGRPMMVHCSLGQHWNFHLTPKGKESHPKHAATKRGEGLNIGLKGSKLYTGGHIHMRSHNMEQK